MKKFVSALCALTLALTATGCQSTASAEDYSNSTLTGEVTDVNGSTVTLQLGELNQSSADSGKPTGEKPDNADDHTPPELPEQSDSKEAGGSQPENGQPPQGAPNGQMPGGSDGQQPPEKPDGPPPTDNADGDSSDSAKNDSDSGNTDNSNAADDKNSDRTAPSEMPAGQPGGAPNGGTSFEAGEETAKVDLSDAEITVEENGKTQDGSLDDIDDGDILVIEFGDDNTIESVTIKAVSNGTESQQGPGGAPGGSGEVQQGTAANTISEDGTVSKQTYTSTGDDENALRVSDASVTLDGVTVSKDGGETSSTESGDFYGMNAALLATDGAEVTIQNAAVTSDAQNGNGVFSYGEGTVVNISDSTITTKQDNSGGIQTTGGGTTNATNLTVETSGNSSAAIRSDRGGGTVQVDGGTYTSNGYNSPAVYSTADVTIKNAELTANNSEALVIEGKNSIALENCTVSGSMSDDKGSSSDINVHNVMLYQSMSGDADVGTSGFSMQGGTLTSNNGDVIYVTNTSSTIELTDVDITNKETDGYFLLVSGNDASHGWGTAGENGAQVTFTAKQQEITGDIAVDTISTLNLTLSDGSSLTGTINIIDNEQNGTAVENNAVVTVESGCTWTLTGDCTLTSLTNNGTINFNGHTITLADGTVLSK